MNDSTTNSPERQAAAQPGMDPTGGAGATSSARAAQSPCGGARTQGPTGGAGAHESNTGGGAHGSPPAVCTCVCTACGHPLAPHDGDDCGCNWPDGCECPSDRAAVARLRSGGRGRGSGRPAERGQAMSGRSPGAELAAWLDRATVMQAARRLRTKHGRGSCQSCCRYRVLYYGPDWRDGAARKLCDACWTPHPDLIAEAEAAATATVVAPELRCGHGLLPGNCSAPCPHAPIAAPVNRG